MAKHPGGRPSKFTQKIADEIIERTCAKETLTSICEDSHMPSCQTVYTWLGKNKEFLDEYAKAKSVRAHLLVDEILKISDEDPEMTVVDEEGNTTTKRDPAGVNRNRLRVDTRKWVASKLLPREYSEKIETSISAPDGGPVNVNSTVRIEGPVAESLGRIADALAKSDRVDGAKQ